MIGEKNSEKFIERAENNGQLTLQKKDSNQRYPDNFNLFRKLKEKLNTKTLKSK